MKSTEIRISTSHAEVALVEYSPVRPVRSGYIIVHKVTHKETEFHPSIYNNYFRRPFATRFRYFFKILCFPGLRSKPERLTRSNRQISLMAEGLDL